MRNIELKNALVIVIIVFFITFAFIPVINGYFIKEGVSNKNIMDLIQVNNDGLIGDNKNWTFMAYLDGDGFDLEEDIPLFINNMELIGSNSIVNVVAQADDYTKWGGETRRYYITYDPNPEVNDYSWHTITSPLADDDTSEKNMGNPKTLSDFVKWSVENYPADHYCLTIFNHGGGFHGLCWDSTSMGDRLTMPEFKNAMEIVSKEIGKNLDLLILEPCNMGQLEVFYQIKDFVDITIASEIPMNHVYISFQGILQILTDFPSIPTVEITQKIVDICYQNFSGEECYHRLIGVQMDKINEIAQAVDTLAQSIINDMPNKKIIYQIYDYSHANNGIVKLANPLDLYKVAEKILDLITSPSDIRDAAQVIISLIDNTVIKPHEDENHTIDNGLNGIAVYFPPNEEFFKRYHGEYKELDLEEDTYWDEFIKAFFEAPNPKTRRSFLFGNIRDLTDLGDVILFYPNYVLVFQFFPPSLKFYTSGEKIIVLTDKKIGGFSLSRIFGVFDYVI